MISRVVRLPRRFTPRNDVHFSSLRTHSTRCARGAGPVRYERGNLLLIFGCVMRLPRRCASRNELHFSSLRTHSTRCARGAGPVRYERGNLLLVYGCVMRLPRRCASQCRNRFILCFPSVSLCLCGDIFCFRYLWWCGQRWCGQNLEEVKVTPRLALPIKVSIMR